MNFLIRATMLVFTFAFIFSSCTKEPIIDETSTEVDFEPIVSESDYFVTIRNNNVELELEGFGDYCIELDTIIVPSDSSEIIIESNYGVVLVGQQIDVIMNASGHYELVLEQGAQLDYFLGWDESAKIGEPVVGYYGSIFNNSIEDIDWDWFEDNSLVEIIFSSIEDTYLSGSFSGWYVDKISQETIIVEGIFVVKRVGDCH